MAAASCRHMAAVAGGRVAAVSCNQGSGAGGSVPRLASPGQGVRAGQGRLAVCVAFFLSRFLYNAGAVTPQMGHIQHWHPAGAGHKAYAYVPPHIPDYNTARDCDSA